MNTPSEDWIFRVEIRPCGAGFEGFYDGDIRFMEDGQESSSDVRGRIGFVLEHLNTLLHHISKPTSPFVVRAEAAAIASANQATLKTISATLNPSP